MRDRNSLRFGDAGSLQRRVKIEGKVELNAMSVTGFVKGRRYVIDAAYSEKNGRRVPAPFEFIGPTASDQQIYSITKNLTGTGIVKLFFTTMKKEVKSDIQFVPMKVDMAPVDQRLKALENVLRKAFAQSVPDTKKAKINGIQNTKVGKYPAIEAIGQYVDAKEGHCCPADCRYSPTRRVRMVCLR